MASLEDYAWAAGYYDGEGSSGLYRGHWNKDGTANLYARVSVGQKDRRTLDRFHRIVAVGQIQERTMNGEPFFYFRCQTPLDVLTVMNCLWLHLGEIKREQFQRTISGTTKASGALRRRDSN